MSVLDGEAYLRYSIDSILKQSFGDFQFIIVNDGSNDGTSEILEAYADPRISIITNESTAGLARALNTCLDEASGEFIARMDADDISKPERFAKQVSFLDAKPDIGIVGSACRGIDEAGKFIRFIDPPLTNLEIHWKRLTGNPFLHSSVMIRREVFERFDLRYDETYRTAQDYELWTHVLSHVQGANLDEPLLDFRFHKDAVSRTQRDRQSENHAKIALSLISDLWPDHDMTGESFADLHTLLSRFGPLPLPADKNRNALLVFYAELLTRFAGKHAAEDGISALVRREAVNTASLALYPPWRPGLMRLLCKLNGLHPGLAGALVIRALGALVGALVGALGRRLAGR